MTAALHPSPAGMTEVEAAVDGHAEKVRSAASAQYRAGRKVREEAERQEAEARTALLNIIARHRSAPGIDEIWRRNIAAHAAAMRMVREAVESFGPIASLESEEATLLRGGAEPTHEAEAIVEALLRVKFHRSAPGTPAVDPDSPIVTRALDQFYNDRTKWASPWRSKQGENSERHAMARILSEAGAPGAPAVRDDVLKGNERDNHGLIRPDRHGKPDTHGGWFWNARTALWQPDAPEPLAAVPPAPTPDERPSK